MQTSTTMGLIWNEEKSRAELWFYHHGAPTCFVISEHGSCGLLECTDAGEQGEPTRFTFNIELAQHLFNMAREQHHE